MSVTVRPYRNGGSEVDIRLRLPNGLRFRERRRMTGSKSAAQRWGENRDGTCCNTGRPNQRRRCQPWNNSRRDSSRDTRVRIVRSQAGSPQNR